MDTRSSDVTVFGATGFTGRLVATELVGLMAGRLDRLALAGRDRDRLHDVRAEITANRPDGDAIGIVVADATDPSALARMAAATAVVATTVGPFARHGRQLVNACIEAGTDYVDINGEPAFLIDTIHSHDEAARRRGVRVVCCCGFDAVPTDLGVWLTVRQLPEDQPMDVESFVTFGGALSGGTWNTVLDTLARGHPRQRVPRPDDGRVARSTRPPIRRVAGMGWTAPMPTVEPHVVLRSAGLSPVYGPALRFGHSVRLGSTPRLLIAAIGVTVLRGAARVPGLRAALGRLRPVGTGPDAQRRARSSFSVTVRASSQVDGVARRASTVVTGGDPGYDETATMLAHSALCLVDDRDELPALAGVLTPAVAFGAPLLARLRHAGMRFAVRA